VLEGVLMPKMLETMGWRTTFMIVGFTALLWLIPWLVVLPKQMRLPTTAEGAAKQPMNVATVRGLITNRNLIGICAGFFCFDYYWYLLLSWLPKYLMEERGLGILKGGFYASLPFLVFGICQPLGGWIGDELARRGWNELKVRRNLITIAFLSGLGLLPVTSVESPNAALGLLMFGCIVGLSTSNMLVILTKCAPKKEIGLWVGIYNFIGNIAGILAPIVTGFMLKEFHSFTLPFVFASVLLLVGIFCFWVIVQGIDRDDAAPAPV
jgi:predicted MFS family arabinose efflux permease